MNNTKFMDKLLDGVEVEWKALGDECFFEIANSGRKPVKASLRVPGETPYYGANNIQDYVEGYTHDGEFVLIAEDGSASLENYSIQYATGKFWANNHVHVIRGKIGVNTRFLYHYLCIVNYIPFLTGGGRAKLTKGSMVEIQIPIPCPENHKKSLEIQAEIVRILDTFTELTVELTAELTARKKQYNYYRDQSLSFEEGEVEWKTLGEICENISSGRNKSKSDVGLYPVFGSTGVIGRTNHKAYDEEQILVARVGANAGRVNIAKGEYDVSDNTLIVKNRKNIVLKYLYYVLVNMNLNQFAKGAGQPLITGGQLKSIQVPVPSSKEQSRIVTLLDKFDALANSITEGLPREIALRQQQYEYYRDLLLSFPKPEKKI